MQFFIMRNFWILVLLFSSPVLANSGVNNSANTLEQTLLTLAKQHNLSIAYSAKLLSGLKAADFPQEADLRTQLKALLTPHELHCVLTSKGIVIYQDVPSEKEVEPIKAQSAAQTSNDIENVTVTEQRISGIYGARNRTLLTSQDTTRLKRELIEFSDSLSRGDLDTFPQQNLVEGLQVIPGIAIEREKGIGQRVNLRSLPNQFTNVSINNLATASGTGDREVDLSIFTSEIVQTVSIKKSSTAADPESGIAGNVQITTGRPFDYLSPKVLAHVEVAHNSLAGNTDPKFSFLATKSWDKWGALFSYANSTRSNRTDSISGVEFRPLTRWLQKSGSDSRQAQSDKAAEVLQRDTGFTITDRFDSDETDRIVFINKVADSASLSTQQRWGAISSLQYKQNDDFLLTFDAMTGAYHAIDDVYQIAAYSGASNSTLDTIYEYDANTLSKNNLVVLSDVSFTETQHEILSLQDKSDIKYAHYNLTADWLWDEWNMVAGVGYSTATRFEDNANLKHVYYGPSRSRFNGKAGETLPSNNVASKNMYYSPTDFQFESYAVSQQRVEDDNYVATFDTAYSPVYSGSPSGLTLQFGTRLSRSNTQSNTGSILMDWPQSGATRSLADSSISAISELLPGGAFSLKDVDWMQVSNARITQIFRPRGLRLPYDNDAYYQVEEQVLSTYLMANWMSELALMPYRVNIGMRHYDTSTTSSGSQLNNEVIQVKQTDYAELLPSFNFSLELVNDLLLRVSASRTFTRPSLEDIAYRRVESASDYKYRDGNPDLRPMFASQWELGLEYYLHSGGLLATSYFQKRISGLIREHLTGIEYNVKKYNANGTLDGYYDYEVYQNVNVDRAYTISGLELIGKLPLGQWWNELEGLQLNATFTLLDNSLQAESDLNLAAPPIGLAKNNLDASLIYSTERYDLLLSYNYRSHYVEYMGYDMYPIYRDSYGQLDIAATFRLNDAIRFSIKGINMADSVESSYNLSPLFPNKYQTAGRRMSLGVIVQW